MDSALAYLSPERRIGFREALTATSRSRTIAWISAESRALVDLVADAEVLTDPQGMEASILGLAVFNDGDLDAALLAFVHPHGNWIDWRAS